MSGERRVRAHRQQTHADSCAIHRGRAAESADQMKKRSSSKGSVRHACFLDSRARCAQGTPRHSFIALDSEIHIESRVPEAAVETHRRAGRINRAAVQLRIGELVGHVVEDVLRANGKPVTLGDLRS